MALHCRSSRTDDRLVSSVRMGRSERVQQVEGGEIGDQNCGSSDGEFRSPVQRPRGAAGQYRRRLVI